jgi:hypothetical protein
MRKLSRSLAALALGVTTFAASMVFAAPQANAAPLTIQCSTWQYATDGGMPIYDFPSAPPPSTRIDTTRNQGIVNVTGFQGNFRYGNFYTADRYRYATGWIYVGHIHYIRCW